MKKRMLLAVITAAVGIAVATAFSFPFLTAKLSSLTARVKPAIDKVRMAAVIDVQADTVTKRVAGARLICFSPENGAAIAYRDWSQGQWGLVHHGRPPAPTFGKQFVSCRTAINGEFEHARTIGDMYLDSVPNAAGHDVLSLVVDGKAVAIGNVAFKVDLSGSADKKDVTVISDSPDGTKLVCFREPGRDDGLGRGLGDPFHCFVNYDGRGVPAEFYLPTVRHGDSYGLDNVLTRMVGWSIEAGAKAGDGGHWEGGGSVKYNF